ncbi:transketolase [Allostreptomyces psammosilenae]|uniref:Transketolase n=1 Tax=Allostreptomyces psammosilenae TaxID=1892865 RepID=A0A853A0P4_9ACTN|nr:transketolase [Allostreptomyces psammosilenae]NYI07955.1 transketolase [Allostreptomyces psammosilenae]
MTVTHHTTGHVTPSTDLADVFELAQQLRVDSVRASTAAGSGHPTSSMSAADVMAVLLARHLTFDWRRPDHPANDHLILSKGHASPLLYAMFKAAGVISDDELVTTYRRAGSRLQGHPTPILPWVDVATGSLGQGLPYGVGVALAGRVLELLPYRVWVLCGDSEMSEGSIWEALDKASYYGLTNLTAIVDVNRLGQRGPTELGWDIDAYASRITAFGCHALMIDGHDLREIDAALDAVSHADRPTVILARTLKGRGFSEVEDADGWHGKALPQDMADRAVAELGGVRQLTVAGPAPTARQEPAPAQAPASVDLPRYEVGEKVATRLAFGKALAALGARPEVVALDAEVGNSTHAEEFGKVHPERYFQTFIAEQAMIAAAVGLSVRGYRPFASTFAAFLTRAHDFVRMAAISQATLALSGSHCGVEIGEDGPSQMGLEDLAMMRSVQGSTVLYPSDATSATALTAAMADLPGISYLRTTRGKYPVLYPADEPFPVGGCKILRSSGTEDHVTLVGAGVTVHECLAAADDLSQRGIRARVIDLYSVKPVDDETLRRAVAETGALVVVEDHHPEGGLGEAVLSALAPHGGTGRFAHLAVRELPASGSSAELLEAAGISARHIAWAARRVAG